MKRTILILMLVSLFAAGCNGTKPPLEFLPEDGPLALVLTWQRDPATTMTIDWHSHKEFPTDTVVIPVVVAIGNHEVRRGYYHRHADAADNDEFRESIAPYFFDLFAFPGQPGYNVLEFGDYMSLIARERVRLATN